MYGGIGVSASSLHRESTDSLIQTEPTESGIQLYIGIAYDYITNSSL